MKIRIKGNSVRYRLTRPEVEKFSKEGYLEEKTEFPGHEFCYALQAKSGISDLDVDMQNGKITLYFPDNEKETWYNSQRVGYKFDKPIGEGKSIFILLEKDFACLDNVEEDQSDNYPNPNAVC
ncbi:MAG: hypothetical protein JNM67_04865 [Bacteroidetes bacterium]|nr:hypothetical protein [Bacteroidota bacterium]